MKRIVLAGGSGFIGSALAEKFSGQGHEVIVLARSAAETGGAIKQVQWDAHTSGAWAQWLEGAEAVVNLAGKSIRSRFTPENRRRIIESRVQAVHAIQSAIRECRTPPRTWVQASACGIYGHAGDRICDESSPPGQDFLAEVCTRWEEAFRLSTTSQSDNAVRALLLRIGVVLGKGGGALQPLARLTRLFLGGTAGAGNQYVSWIHRADLVEIVAWAVHCADVKGVFNATAPRPVQNRELMGTLREVLHRPWSPPVPALAVKVGAALMGTDPSLALAGQRCVPKRLLEHGYRFKYPELRAALVEILGK